MKIPSQKYFLVYIGYTPKFYAYHSGHFAVLRLPAFPTSSLMYSLVKTVSLLVPKDVIVFLLTLSQLSSYLNRTHYSSSTSTSSILSSDHISFLTFL